MISATVTGNIGKNPELKQTRNGKTMCTFSLASNQKRQDREQETTWIDCVAFDQTAEAVAGNLGKGMRVVAVGNMSMEHYQKRDGGEGSSLRMVVNDIGLAVRATANQQSEPSSDDRW